MITVSVELDDAHFELLIGESAPWGEWSEEVGLRFEYLRSDRPHVTEPAPYRHMAYMLPDNKAGLVVAEAYLRARGEAFDVLRDRADGGYVIATDYLTATCRERVASGDLALHPPRIPLTAGDVTDEIFEAVWRWVPDGADPETVDWRSAIERAEGATLTDGSVLRFPWVLESPAVDRLKRLIRKRIKDLRNKQRGANA